MADKTITQEISEFRDAIKTYDPANVSASLHRCVDEGFDVIGKIVNLDDSPEVIAELGDSVSDALSDFLDKALASRPFARNGAKLAVSFAVPSLINEAATYTGTAEAFWDEKIEPVLAEVESLIHGIRLDMAG